MYHMQPLLLSRARSTQVLPTIKAEKTNKLTNFK
jgi:hypothetical protein